MGPRKEQTRLSAPSMLGVLRHSVVKPYYILLVVPNYVTLPVVLQLTYTLYIPYECLVDYVDIILAILFPMP